MKYEGRFFQVDFDFTDDILLIRTSDGSRRTNTNMRDSLMRIEDFQDDENKAARFTDDNAYRENFTADYH
jgi:hypothetical protein